MSSEEVFEKVKGIIVEQLGVAETSVTMEEFMGTNEKELVAHE